MACNLIKIKFYIHTEILSFGIYMQFMYFTFIHFQSQWNSAGGIVFFIDILTRCITLFRDNNSYL